MDHQTDSGTVDTVTPQAKDHTEGSIIRSILHMGLPSMIGFSLGNIYELVNAFWLSRLGPEPVAAITILGPVFWVIYSANSAVGAGSVAIISRRYGEKDRAEAEAAIKEAIILKWIAAVCFGAIGYALTPLLLRLLGAEGNVLDMGITFGRIVFLGLGFNFATYTIFTALRGVANPIKAMVIMIAFNVFNMILDPILIFGWWIFPKMGIAGAGWAVFASYVLAFAIGMIMFYTGRANVRLHWKGRRPIQWSRMWMMVKIGIPSAVGTLSFSVGRLVVMPMITIFGVNVVAAYGVGIRVTNLGATLLVGIGLGLSALIGHNLGAGKRERTRRTANQAILLGIEIMTVMAAVSFVFARQITGLFFQEPDIVAYGETILRILAASMPFLGLYLMIENVYTGVGENRPTMVLNIIHSWIFEIPAVYITTRLLGLSQTAVWWSLSGALVVASLLYYWYYRRGQWLHVKV
ncbi:MAG: MATE family efflux transporter [candidate division Zixibacteria bacterium]|nr:MATE family efflux transporter [candidate division Zixibacteria bacterium]